MITSTEQEIIRVAPRLTPTTSLSTFTVGGSENEQVDFDHDDHDHHRMMVRVTMILIIMLIIVTMMIIIVIVIKTISNNHNFCQLTNDVQCDPPAHSGRNPVLRRKIFKGFDAF